MTNAAVAWVAAGSAVGTVDYLTAATLNAITGSVLEFVLAGYYLSWLLLGIGMMLSKVYPRWMAWVVLAVLAVIFVSGFPGVLTSPAQMGGITFTVPAVLTATWALILGVWVTRRAW